MLPWMSWLAALGVAPAAVYLIAQKQEKKDVELYDLKKAVGAEIGGLIPAAWAVARVSNKARGALLVAVNAASERINAHFETHAKAVYEARVEAARRAGEDREALRRSSQNAGIEGAIEVLRAHKTSILAHLDAQETLNGESRMAERDTLREFVAGAEMLMRARLAGGAR